jgi:EamA domain-containing membrane protein RarD
VRLSDRLLDRTMVQTLVLLVLAPQPNSNKTACCAYTDVAVTYRTKLLAFSSLMVFLWAVSHAHHG